MRCQNGTKEQKNIFPDHRRTVRKACKRRKNGRDPKRQCIGIYPAPGRGGRAGRFKKEGTHKGDPVSDP